MREIAEGFCVSGQITPEQAGAIADAGFAAIICNRPDGEVPGQPAAAAVKAEAERLGLSFFHIPVAHGVGITRESVDATREALSQVSGPVFAYCRSGARSTNLFAIANS
jgi:uncharacterized protein (TIGR01244 family)